MRDYVFREDAVPPYPHQEKYLRESCERRAYAAFWEQGTSKTRFIVDTAALLYRERIANGLLVIAPNGVHADDWAADVQAFTPPDVLERVRFHAYRTKSARTKYHREACEALLPHKGLAILTMSFEAFMTKIGYELAGEFLRRRLVLWTIDESGRMKSTKRMRALSRYKNLGVYRRILDGTPVFNSPFHVYNPVRFLDPGFWERRGLGTKSKFETRYGVWARGYARGREFPKFVRYKNMKELQGILSEIGSRVDKSVLGLPPKVRHHPLYFDLTPEQVRVYDELENNFEAQLDDGSRVESEIVLTKIQRMREVASGYIRNAETEEVTRFKENPRADALREIVKDIPHQAIVWCNFTPEVEDVCAALGRDAARYDGKTTDTDRAENKRAFKAGERKYFVTTYKAACRGHNLTEARSVIEYSDTYDAEDKAQSEDRAHRSGQKYSVDYRTITMRPTAATRSIDDDVREACGLKVTLARYLLDRRGSYNPR